MKYTLIALVAILAIASAQHPRPVPISIKNATVFDGIWYAVWGYDYNDDNAFGANISCYVWNVTVTENGYAGEIDEFLNDTQNGLSNFTRFFHINDNGGIWHIETETWAWVAIDPIGGQWGTLADEFGQRAIILSRTNNLTSLIANAQVALLKGEGYAVNATNGVTISNAGCPSIL